MIRSLVRLQALWKHFTVISTSIVHNDNTIRQKYFSFSKPRI